MRRKQTETFQAGTQVQDERTVRSIIPGKNYTMKTLGSVFFEALLYCFEMLSDQYKKALWQTRDALPAELDLPGSDGGSDGATRALRSAAFAVARWFTTKRQQPMRICHTLRPFFCFFCMTPPPLSHFQL